MPVDLRLIFATNAELEKDVERGRFRADLFYRINVMQIRLPLLTERDDDVQELATLFMRKLSQQLGMPPVEIGDTVRTALARYDWPGNVRELRNLIERTLILGAFPDDFGGTPSPPADAAVGSLADIEQRHILSVLKDAGGNRDEAARRIGISRKTIDRKCALWNV